MQRTKLPGLLEFRKCFGVFCLHRQEVNLDTPRFQFRCQVVDVFVSGFHEVSRRWVDCLNRRQSIPSQYLLGGKPSLVVEIGTENQLNRNLIRCRYGNAHKIETGVGMG